MKDTINMLVSAILEGDGSYAAPMRMTAVYMLLNAARDEGFITDSDLAEIMEEHSLATLDDR